MTDAETMMNQLKQHRMQQVHSVHSVPVSVLIPLIEKDGDLSILFEVRSSSIPQGHEICFPGGHMEENETPLSAAERETCEELLVKSEQITNAVTLFESDEHGNLNLFCSAGILNDYHGSFSESEVDHVFTLPLDELLKITPRQSVVSWVPSFDDSFPFDLIPGGKEYPWRSRKKRFWFYQTRFGVIWGMTAEMLYWFLEEVRKAGC